MGGRKQREQEVSSSIEETSQEETNQESSEGSEQIDDDTILQIASKKIQDTFYSGNYGPIQVVIDARDGYVNLSHVCSQLSTKDGKPKEYYDYSQSKEAKALLRALSKQTGIPVEKLTRERSDKGDDISRGTFGHAKLVPHVAMWCDLKFALIVSDIGNNFFKHEELDRKDSEETCALGKKDLEYYMVLYRNNGDDEDDRQYTSTRAQLQGTQSGRRRQMKKYPDSEEISCHADVPNAGRFWNCVRDKCKGKLINFNSSYTSFDLKPGFSERRFLRIVDEVYAERMMDVV